MQGLIILYNISLKKIDPNSENQEMVSYKLTESHEPEKEEDKGT